MLTLILGGRRSGKSLWAENEALSLPCQRRLYLATASGLGADGSIDASMQARIAAHRARRGPDWLTLEEPLHLLRRLKQEAAFDLLFVDCVSVWLSNLMLQGFTDTAILDEVEALTVFLEQLSQRDQAGGILSQGDCCKTNVACPVFLISNEVGLGVASSTALGNRFCDLAGLANQRLARAAHRVIFVAAGLPLVLKERSIS